MGEGVCIKMDNGIPSRIDRYSVPLELGVSWLERIDDAISPYIFANTTFNNNGSPILWIRSKKEDKNKEFLYSTALLHLGWQSIPNPGDYLIEKAKEAKIRLDEYREVQNRQTNKNQI